jgi:divalent metal cation (Fe/Co/Zn/Cd) transporter
LPIVNKSMAAAAVILAVSCFILANTLTRSQPINVVVDGETVTTIHTPVLYQATEVAVIIISSVAAGISAFYLYLEQKNLPCNMKN